MPISIDEFEDRDETDRRVTNAERVMAFLVRHDDQAFRAAEIADRTEVPKNSIHPVLSRLEDRDLVRHKEPYWAVGDPDHVREAFTFHSTASFLDEELGPESRAEWLQAAEDSEDA